MLESIDSANPGRSSRARHALQATTVQIPRDISKRSQATRRNCAGRRTSAHALRCHLPGGIRESDLLEHPPPGSWDAEEAAPVADAASRATSFGLDGRAQFRIGEFAATVFTSWDFADSPPNEPQPSDHRPLLGEERADRMIAHYRQRLALFPGWQRILVVARRA
jgi:hypothetical protein